MTPQVFKARVQSFATGLMGLTFLYLMYYIYISFWRAYRFCFGEPERWLTHWAVEHSAEIAHSTRMTYFAIWVAIILLSVFATVAGIALLNRCRRGLIFDARTARSVQVFGGLLVVAMVGDQVFGAVEMAIITQHNTVNNHPIAWAYDPSDFKSIALAVVLFMFGWVMKEAIEIEQTNKEFV